MHYYFNNDPIPIITLLSIYSFTNILFSSYEILSRKKGFHNIFPLFYTYMVIHISYGIGNIIGLFTLWINGSQTKQLIIISIEMNLLKIGNSFS